jgi:hypothetical protein
MLISQTEDSQGTEYGEITTGQDENIREKKCLLGIYGQNKPGPFAAGKAIA